MGVCGVERTTFSLCLHLPLCLTRGSLVCRYIYQASWPLKFQGLSCFCLPSHSRNNGFTDTTFRLGFLELLGTQTQVLTFVWQVFYSENHLPNLLYI